MSAEYLTCNWHKRRHRRLQTPGVTPAAPRYDPMVLEAIRRLDDDRLPIAETCRRVGQFAAKLDLPRPSYVHLRRIVKAKRERARELEGVSEALVGEILSGRAPSLYTALARQREAEARARLRRTSS